MYLAAKKLGRCHCGDRPTTAMVRQRPSTSRRVLMVSGVRLMRSSVRMRKAAVLVMPMSYAGHTMAFAGMPRAPAIPLVEGTVLRSLYQGFLSE